MTEQHQPRPPRFERLTGAAAAAAAVIAALAAAGGFVLGIHNPWASNPQDITAAKNARAVAAHEISKCERTHGLRAQRSSSGVPYGRHIVLRRCDWPPLVTTSSDGYTEIHDNVTQIAGKRDSALYNVVDHFIAPCDQIDVEYVLDHMNVRLYTGRRLDVSRLYLVLGSPEGSVRIERLSYVPSDVDIPLPSAASNSFFVLHSGHFALFDAACAFGRPPR